MSRGPGAASIAGRVAALYGHDLRDAEGVVHVTSAWRPPEGGLASLAINDATPQSASDSFVLALARARADALITTGRILREEPALVHAPSGEVDLLAWRQEVLGKREPPMTVVLTGGAGLDLDHPVLAGPQRRLVYTTRSGAEGIADEVAPRGIEVVGEEAPSLRGLLAWLRGTCGCRTLLVEAGASTSANLYRLPAVIDELLLSICGAALVPVRARGPALPDEEVIHAAGLVLRNECELEEESGPWSFRRYRR